jgi:hypothetical protein
VRWQGLLRVGDASDADAGQGGQDEVFTFETVVARESHERVRLLVDDQVVIDAWPPTNDPTRLISQHMPPLGTIGLRGGYYYSIILEYSHRAADGAAGTSPAQNGYVQLKWHSAQTAAGGGLTPHKCSSSDSGGAATLYTLEQCLFASRPIAPLLRAARGILSAGVSTVSTASPSSLRVLPARTCATKSLATSARLSEAEAGQVRLTTLSLLAFLVQKNKY